MLEYYYIICYSFLVGKSSHYGGERNEEDHEDSTQVHAEERRDESLAMSFKMLSERWSSFQLCDPDSLDE